MTDTMIDLDTRENNRIKPLLKVIGIQTLANDTQEFARITNTVLHFGFSFIESNQLPLMTILHVRNHLNRCMYSRKHL